MKCIKCRAKPKIRRTENKDTGEVEITADWCPRCRNTGRDPGLFNKQGEEDDPDDYFNIASSKNDDE
jgi:Zn-finger nucleic acid-binding protein